MRKASGTLCCFLSLSVVVAPMLLRGQTPGDSPSPTQSQSGYPDVRQEAADPTLFPNPDEAAKNAVRPKTARGTATTKGRDNTGGGRINNQVLKDADSDPLPVKIAYRRAKTLAMERNPGLAKLAEEADTAPTDVEKRRYLRIYYDQLFAAVGKIDSTPAMKSHLDALKKFTEQRYNPQRRAVAGEEDIVAGRANGRQNRTH